MIESKSKLKEDLSLAATNLIVINAMIKFALPAKISQVLLKKKEIQIINVLVLLIIQLTIQN